MNGPSNDSANDRSGIGETMTAALRQPSFLRVALLLAATVVVFVGMRLSAPVLDPPGAFLAAPLTIFLVLMLDTFPETRWLANVMGMGAPEPEAPGPEEQTVEPTGRPRVSP